MFCASSALNLLFLNSLECSVERLCVYKDGKMITGRYEIEHELQAEYEEKEENVQYSEHNATKATYKFLLTE